jgi:hypothetical protein
MARKVFNDAAKRLSAYRRDAAPPADKVAAKGIKTRESLDWMNALYTSRPDLTFEHGNAFTRAAATEAARDEHRARIARLWEEFRARPLKARGDFRLARDYRGQERER